MATETTIRNSKSYLIAAFEASMQEEAFSKKIEEICTLDSSEKAQKVAELFFDPAFHALFIDNQLNILKQCELDTDICFAAKALVSAWAFSILDHACDAFRSQFYENPHGEGHKKFEEYMAELKDQVSLFKEKAEMVLTQLMYSSSPKKKTTTLMDVSQVSKAQTLQIYQLVKSWIQPTQS